jgi:cytochrome c
LRPRVRPGDGAPLQRPPPELEIGPALASFASAQVAGLASRGEAIVAALDDGSLRALTESPEDRPSRAAGAAIAAGLDGPCGVATLGARLFVLQASELTELVDLDGDGSADEYRCALAWREVAGAELRPRALAPFGSGLLALLEDPRDGATLAVQIAPDPRTASIVARLPLPAGSLALAAQGETLVGDVGWNDGGGARVSALEGGTLSTVARFPHGAAGARAIPLARIERGAFAGQWLVGGVAPGSIERLFLERVEGRTQGCVFRFAGGLGTDATAATRDAGGALYVAATDPERRTAKVERWVERGDTPFDLRTVRALPDGFEIELTEPLAPGFGSEPAGWKCEAIEPASPLPGRALAVLAASADVERRRVRLEVDGLRPRSIVHVRAIAPLRSAAGGEPWTAEAWYALERIPSDGTDFERGAKSEAETELAQPREGWLAPFSRAELAALAATDRRRVIVVSSGDWADFVLELDWRARPGATGAVRYRVGSTGEGLSYALTDELHRDALDPLRIAGACRDVAPAAVAAAAPSGAWQCSRIVARGARVEHWLNGAKVLELDLAGDEWRRRGRDFAAAPEGAGGRIALEADGRGLEVRALEIRPLR